MRETGAANGMPRRPARRAVISRGETLNQHRLRAPGDFENGEKNMGTILLIVLILLLVGALPTWPYSNSWGYYPSGGLGLVVVVLLVLVLLGRV